MSKAHFILQSEGKFGRSGELEEGEVAFLQTSRSCMELAIGVFDRPAGWDATEGDGPFELRVFEPAANVAV